MTRITPTTHPQTGIVYSAGRILRHVAVALVLLLSLVRCESGAVEERFEEIVMELDSGRQQSVFAMMDQPTEDYFTKLLEAIKSNDAAAAKRTGEKLGIPISTLLVYEQLAFEPESPDESEAGTEITMTDAEWRKMLQLVLMLDNTGVFRHSAEHPLKIHEGAAVSGDQATLSVTVPTGDAARLATTFVFAREEGVWNLNFPSTLKAVEKIYAQAQRRSGLDPHQYAKSVVVGGGGPTEFRYRM